MDAGTFQLPPCPLTGRPAKRRIRGFSAGFLKDIWRFYQGIDVSHLLAGVTRFDIYESDTGLVFIEPRIIGDGKFYHDYYTHWDVHARLTATSEIRVDYKTAARFVPEGAEIIDVGCGPGVFRQHVRHARYTGLDPYAGEDVDDVVIRKTLDEYAEESPGRYDVASAFHVIEHVKDPLHHARMMAKLLRPGGLLILAAPLHPSPLTEIPNLPINIPPHHVTWWNPGAFQALATEIGLEVVEATVLPASPHQSIIMWLHRLLISRTTNAPDEVYVAHRWRWHLSMAIAYPLAKVASRIKALPAGARPVDAFLVARKPGGSQTAMPAKGD